MAPEEGLIIDRRCCGVASWAQWEGAGEAAVWLDGVLHASFSSDSEAV